MITSPVDLVDVFPAGGATWQPVPLSSLAPGLGITSGIYGPVLTPSAATIAAFAADPWIFQRIGNIVSVWGNVQITWPGYVAGLVSGQIIASVPILPTFPNLGAAGPVAAGDTATGIPYTAGSVVMAINDVSLSFATLDGAPQYVGLSFAYRLA